MPGGQICCHPYLLGCTVRVDDVSGFVRELEGDDVALEFAVQIVAAQIVEGFDKGLELSLRSDEILGFVQHGAKLECRATRSQHKERGRLVSFEDFLSSVLASCCDFGRKTVDQSASAEPLRALDLPSRSAIRPERATAFPSLGGASSTDEGVSNRASASGQTKPT